MRPLIAIAAIVVLLASGLAIGNLAARDNRLMPLIWAHAIVPGVICFWLLVGPQIMSARGARAA
jgi:lipopolysaccharide export system permease protein